MSNSQKNQSPKLILLIIFLIILISGGIYFFLYQNISSSPLPTKVECLKVSYEEQDLNKLILYTTTNYLEGFKTIIKLKKNSNCDNYNSANIYLYIDEKIVNDDSQLLSGDLNYIILDENKIPSDYGTIKSNGSNLLKTVPLTEDKTSYAIYLWVNPLSNHIYDNIEFSGHIYADID